MSESNTSVTIVACEHLTTLMKVAQMFVDTAPEDEQGAIEEAIIAAKRSIAFQYPLKRAHRDKPVET